MSDEIVTPLEGVITDTAALKPEGEGKPDPVWLKGRLEQAERGAKAALLKELGTSDAAEIKAALADLQSRRDAQKSAEQKAAELGTKLGSVEAEKAALHEALRDYADVQLSSLTELQKAAVLATAGESPSKQLATIKALMPTWSTKPADPIVPPATPKGKSSTTATKREAPGGAPGTQEENPKETYARLQTVNPFAAASYANKHPEVHSKE